MLFAGLPCGSFVYLSQGTHRRHATRWGQEQYEFVAHGNTLGSRFAFLAAVATVREVYWAVENPLRTHLFWLPPLVWLLHLPIGAIAARWCLASTLYYKLIKYKSYDSLSLEALLLLKSLSACFAEVDGLLWGHIRQAATCCWHGAAWQNLVKLFSPYN